MSEPIKNLENDKNIYVNQTHFFVSIYDDNEYDRSDHDALNGSQKKYIAHQLASFDYKWKTGRTLSSDSYELQFHCPKPKLLMSSPVEALKHEGQSDSKNYYLLTPTQALAQLLLKAQNSQDFLSQAFHLLDITPANILKLLDGLRDERAVFLEKNLKDLLDYQNSVTSQPHFKNKRTLASIL